MGSLPRCSPSTLTPPPSILSVAAVPVLRWLTHRGVENGPSFPSPVDWPFVLRPSTPHGPVDSSFRGTIHPFPSARRTLSPGSCLDTVTLLLGTLPGGQTLLTRRSHPRPARRPVQPSSSCFPGPWYSSPVVRTHLAPGTIYPDCGEAADLSAVLAAPGDLGEDLGPAGGARGHLIYFSLF